MVIGVFINLIAKKKSLLLIKLKEKSHDLNRNSSRNKNETMFGSVYENCPEFGVLGGVIFKLDIL